MNRIALLVFIVALAVTALVPVAPVTPGFWVTQLNYIGLAEPRGPGPGACSPRGGRPHLVR